MKFTDKEVKLLKRLVESILDEVSKFVSYEDTQRPLNNRKFTLSYKTNLKGFYVGLYCKDNLAYYFSVDDYEDKYSVSGWSYLNNKIDTSTMFTIFVNKNSLILGGSELDAIANSISSKERLTNLCTSLDLVVLTNDMVKWELQDQLNLKF